MYAGRKKNLIAVKIGIHPDLTDQECWKLLEEFMPDYVRKRKMTQKLFIRCEYIIYTSNKRILKQKVTHEQ